MRYFVARLIFAAPLGAADPLETWQRHERVAERRRPAPAIAQDFRIPAGAR